MSKNSHESSARQYLRKAKAEQAKAMRILGSAKDQKDAKRKAESAQRPISKALQEASTAYSYAFHFAADSKHQYRAHKIAQELLRSCSGK